VTCTTPFAIIGGAMALDFTRMRRVSAADSATEPRRVFTALPQKDPKYGYARDVQSEVWEAWNARKDERDLVVKMNTGGGKTIVGLVIAKASLNEGAGPAAYISPDSYLAEQVREEGARLGLETADDPYSSRFQSGQAILVTHVHRLFNGLSVFGTKRAGRSPLEVGTLLIDDAHACLSTVEQQFTLEMPKSHPAYKRLLSLFEAELHQQAPTTFRDIRAGDRSAVLAVPYWAWAERQEQVLAVLHPHRDDDEFKFRWPLVADALHLSHVAVTADAIEIRPPCPAVDEVPSFAQARRRIYLTATLADDSVLVTHFGADSRSIERPVTPRSADDLGDRMILTPKQTHPGVSDNVIRAFVADQAKAHNVVVIVPSYRRAEPWKALATGGVHGADSMRPVLRNLRSEHVGLVVLVNKYDGIDLPGKACRVLVLDGLPEAEGALARLEAVNLSGSDAMLTRQVHRIEQGMGRGIRSNDDYCAVLLLGSSLTRRLHGARARTRFSPATRAQLELSDQVAEQLRHASFEELAGAIEQCLDRDPEWVAASRDALDGLGYPDTVSISPVAVARREAFELAQMHRYADSAQRLRAAIDAVDDLPLRGLLKQEAAAYLHLADPVGAQRLQASAMPDNRTLTKPRAGIGYVPLRSPSKQAEALVAYLAERYEDGPSLQLGFAAVLDDLVPNPDPQAVPPFEQAMRDLALHLGFSAQLPEREFGNGPDVMWLLGKLQYLVIECKSAATAIEIPRHDAAQLSHSIDWFRATYDDSCEATPVLIHPSRTLHRRAQMRAGAQIITFDRLEKLRDAVRDFATSISNASAYTDPARVGERLAVRHLNAPAFIQYWGIAPKPSTER
jgi:hypothetical protein